MSLTKRGFLRGEPGRIKIRLLQNKSVRQTSHTRRPLGEWGNPGNELKFEKNVRPSRRKATATKSFPRVSTTWLWCCTGKNFCFGGSKKIEERKKRKKWAIGRNSKPVIKLTLDELSKTNTQLSVSLSLAILLSHLRASFLGESRCVEQDSATGVFVVILQVVTGETIGFNGEKKSRSPFKCLLLTIDLCARSKETERCHVNSATCGVGNTTES